MSAVPTTGGNPLPQELLSLNSWVVWRYVQKPGEPKPRKLPYYMNGRPREGQQGTPEDLAGMGTFSDAYSMALRGGFNGVGLAMVEGNGLVGLDFDDCVTDGVVRADVLSIVQGTYCEFSPSGKGIRAFYRGALRDRKDHNEHGRWPFAVEFFHKKGYLTVTGRPLNEAAFFAWGIAPYAGSPAEALYTERFGVGLSLVVGDDFDPLDALSLGAKKKVGMSVEKARVLLESLSADCGHDEWINTGQSLHYEFDGSEQALELWREWSKTSEKYPGDRQLASRWESFGRYHGKQITGAYLLRHAKDATVLERYEALAHWREKIKETDDEMHIREKLCPSISKDKRLTDVEREGLAQLLQKVLGFLGTKLAIGFVRKLIAPADTQVPTVKTKYPLTEFGNTDRMLARYADSLMFVPETEAWYCWTGVYWRRATSTEIEFYAKETIKGLVNEVDDHENQLGEFFDFCRVSQQKKMVSNMVALAASDPRVLVPSGELDKHKALLCVQNGVVDLRTGRLMPPDPMFRMTRICSTNYVPEARAPLFEKVLSDVFFNDKDMVQFFLRVIGYAAVGDPVDDIMVIPYGDGSNGKSTVFGTIRRVLGSYAKVAEAGTFVSDAGTKAAGGAREDIVRLQGTRFVYVAEPDEGAELREGAIKSMTGGDPMPARGVYGKVTVEVEPTWVPFMPTNHKPIIKGNDNGIWRRLVLIPFLRNFEDDKEITKDEKLAEKLVGEAEGVLGLVVAAAGAYLAHGLQQPAVVKKARDDYRSQMDLLAEWLDECCEVAPGHSEEMKRLWLSWEAFAKTRGVLGMVRSSVALGKRMDKRFPSVKDGYGKRMRQGLRLRVLEVDRDEWAMGFFKS
jgi:putative DNA primase/helicase